MKKTSFWTTIKHSQTIDQEDKMGVGVLMMVILWMSFGKVTGCSVRRIVPASKLSTVNVSCPSIVGNSSEVKFLLLFNDSRIHQIHLYEPESAKNFFSNQFEVTAQNSGVYICHKEEVYPPPPSEDCHTTEVIVTETQSLPTNHDTDPVVKQSCPVRSLCIPDVVMWTVCCVLFVYSLCITCITFVIWRKLKRYGQDTNVYMNTRPATPRKPNKV